jgi:hypothetical protein
MSAIAASLIGMPSDRGVTVTLWDHARLGAIARHSSMIVERQSAACVLERRGIGRSAIAASFLEC